MAVLGLRGVAAPEVYPADFSKYVPLNTVDDDAVINITAVLNLFPSSQDRYTSLINIGGPFLVLGRGIMSLAEYIGIIHIFDEPSLYISYPGEYQRIWIVFGIYKLFLFLWLFPIVVYWVGRNHLSPRAGGIAAWMIVAIPFVTAFDARMKADSPAIITGMFTLLFLFQYAKDRHNRTLAIASGLLGLSLSIKFLMIPSGALLLAVIIQVASLTAPLGVQLSGVWGWPPLLFWAYFSLPILLRSGASWDILRNSLAQASISNISPHTSLPEFPPFSGDTSPTLKFSTGTTSGSWLLLSWPGNCCDWQSVGTSSILSAS